MIINLVTTRKESVHQVTTLFSDCGTPASYREMNGYSGHTYKWSTKDGKWVYVQVHFISDQGIKTLTNEEAGALSGSNPHHAQEDLFKEIDKGNYPFWTCYIQTMTAEVSVFDLIYLMYESQLQRRWPKIYSLTPPYLMSDQV